MKLFKKDELKLLWPFYADNFIATALFVLTPFYFLYFISIGLSAFQMSLLFALWSFASLVLDIPTGAIADVYGRKFSVVLGWFLQGLFTILVFFTHNFYLLAGLYFLMGASTTLVSGSADAWAVDLIKSKKIKHYGDYFSRKASLISAGLFLSGFIGAFVVAKFGLNALWIVSGGALILAAIFLLFAEETHSRGNLNSLSKIYNKTKDQTKDSLKYIRGHHVIFLLFIIVIFHSFAMDLSAIFSWTPVLQSSGMPDYAFGYLWSAANVLGIFVPYFARKYSKDKSEKKALFYSYLLFISISCLALIAYNLIFTAILFLALFVFLDFHMPLRSSYMHRFIPSKLRATIGSTESMLISLVGIISWPLTGYLIDTIGGRYVILIAGLIAIPAMIIYYKIDEGKVR